MLPYTYYNILTIEKPYIYGAFYTLKTNIKESCYTPAYQLVAHGEDPHKKVIQVKMEAIFLLGTNYKINIMLISTIAS